MNSQNLARREKNVMVFNDTEHLCRTNETLAAAVKESNCLQYIITEDEQVEVSKDKRYEDPAQVIVSKKRSLEAASAYKGCKVCVHNFASATNPGGGVVRGSNAQEEAICRCSSLYFNISEPVIVNQYHNLHKQMLRNGVMDTRYNDDCIFTPGVMVFKSDTSEPEVLPKENWYQVDIITCAAPNLRENPSNSMNPGSGNHAVKLTDKELLELHMKRSRRILEIAKKEREEVLILGAFGCGAFSNPPQIVAEAMARVLKDFLYDFKTIELAIYCSTYESKNYDVFQNRFRMGL